MPFEEVPKLSVVQEKPPFDYGAYNATRLEEGVRRSGDIDEAAFKSVLSEKAYTKLTHVVMACVQFLSGDTITYTFTPEQLASVENNDEQFLRKEIRAKASEEYGGRSPLEDNRLRLSNGLSSVITFSHKLGELLDADGASDPVALGLRRHVQQIMTVIDPYETFGARYVGMRTKEDELEKLIIIRELGRAVDSLLDYVEHPQQEQLAEAA